MSDKTEKFLAELKTACTDDSDMMRLVRMVELQRETLEFYANRAFYKKAYDRRGNAVGCTVDEGSNARSTLAELDRIASGDGEGE